MPMVIRDSGGSSIPPMTIAWVVMRLPSWTGLSKRRNSSTAFPIAALSERPAISFALSAGHSVSAYRALPIRLVVVS